jgi:hypothetical protein
MSLKSVSIKPSPTGAGLGDNLIGYASLHSIADRIKAKVILVDLPFFRKGPLKIKKEYLTATIEPDLKIDVECGGRITRKNIKKVEFWNELMSSTNIEFRSDAEILSTLIENKSSPFSYKNMEEVIKDMRNSLNKLFEVYTIPIEIKLPHICNDYELIAVHLRSGDDILMRYKMSLDRFPRILNVSKNILKGIDDHLQNNPPRGKYKIMILGDSSSQDLYNLARKCIPHQDIIPPTLTSSVHSSKDINASHDELIKVWEDFFYISKAFRVYASLNSNYSRSAMITGKMPLESRFFVNKKGEVRLVYDSLPCKKVNCLFNEN